MNDFLERVTSLPEDKRRLLDILLRREPAARPELAEEYVPPRNGLEQKLADIWAAVLGVERVGVNDHFIELGGDSILAIQVLAMARTADIHLTSRQIFATPTIASMAEALTEEQDRLPRPPAEA